MLFHVLNFIISGLNQAHGCGVNLISMDVFNCVGFTGRTDVPVGSGTYGWDASIL